MVCAAPLKNKLLFFLSLTSIVVGQVVIDHLLETHRLAIARLRFAQVSSVLGLDLQGQLVALLMILFDKLLLEQVLL
jgi:hypothetical protein